MKCLFYIMYGKDTIWHCGLEANHEGDHQIAIPKSIPCKNCNGKLVPVNDVYAHLYQTCGKPEPMVVE